MKKGRFYRPFFVISFLALNALPEILSKGTMVFANDERHPGKLGFMFAAPVEIMGKKTYVGAVVHQMIADGQNKFYLLDMVDERGWRFGIEKDADSSMGRVPQGVVTGESVASFKAKVTQKPDVVKPSKSQLNVDTDNPLYRSGVEEADYGEALPDGYSEYEIVQEMLSDARGTMNDFKGNTKLKAEPDEEVRQQVGERRTGTRGSGSNRSELGIGSQETQNRRGYRRGHPEREKAGHHSPVIERA
ncbi:MAG: hypothetical protein KBS46_06590 [Clostridiales bacterium]|nr:hypothetical protein [Candidatus Apopatocola equi]